MGHHRCTLPRNVRYSHRLTRKYSLIFVFCPKNCSKEGRKDPKELKVVVGTNDLTSAKMQYTVQRLIVHEKYNKPLLANDVGLMEINGSIQFDGKKVQPINYSKRFVNAGEQVLITGWGRLGVSNDNYISNNTSKAGPRLMLLIFSFFFSQSKN